MEAENDFSLLLISFVSETERLRVLGRKARSKQIRVRSADAPGPTA